MSVGVASDNSLACWLNLAKATIAQTLLRVGGSRIQVAAIFDDLDEVQLPSLGHQRQVLLLNDLLDCPEANLESEWANS